MYHTGRIVDHVPRNEELFGAQIKVGQKDDPALSLLEVDWEVVKAGLQ